MHTMDACEPRHIHKSNQQEEKKKNKYRCKCIIMNKGKEGGALKVKIKRCKWVNL
jgi:hypothetical protein